MTPADHDRKDESPTGRTGTRRGVRTERIVVGLLLICVAGTLNLVIVLHRRGTASAPAPPAKPATAPVAAKPAASPSPPKVAQARKPAESPKPQPPPVDPTKKALAELEGATARELEEIKKADRRTEAMEKARQAAVADSARWRRRETLIRSQVASLTEKAKKIEQQVGEIDLERDALARERDALKAALTSANTKSSYAVLPFKGANGTWQRPIVLECENGSVTLQPRGLNFSMLDLNPHIHPRASIVVQTIARELTVMEAAGSPDGAPVVPSLVFVVRPDGIRAYYEARARLEPLGISFGYELVPQDLKINFPDLADVRTWDGTVPLDVPSHLKGHESDPASGRSGPSSQPPVGDLAMNGTPGSSPGAKLSAGDAWASGAKANAADGSNDAVWPSRPGGGRAYGSGMGDALAPGRGSRSGGFSPTAPGAGGRGFGTPSADRGGHGSSRGGQGSGSGGGGLGSGGAGGGARGSSAGVWATPGDGSSDRPNPGGGAGEFASRGTPGSDPNGSEFGFGDLPGMPGGAAGQRGGRAGQRNGSGATGPQNTPGDLAGLLEAVPGNGNPPGGGLGSMVQDWTGTGDPTGSGIGTGGASGDPSGLGNEPGGVSTGGGSGTGRGSGIREGLSGKSTAAAVRRQPDRSARGSSATIRLRDRSRARIPPIRALRATRAEGLAARPGRRTPRLDGRRSRPASCRPSHPAVPGMARADPCRRRAGRRGFRGSAGIVGEPQVRPRRPPRRGSASACRRACHPRVLLRGRRRDRRRARPPGSMSRDRRRARRIPAPRRSRPTTLLNDLPPLPTPERKEPIRIDAPFEVVIDCQRDGIEILPGGNRITLKTIKAAPSTRGEGAGSF